MNSLRCKRLIVVLCAGLALMAVHAARSADIARPRTGVPPRPPQNAAVTAAAATPDASSPNMPRPPSKALIDKLRVPPTRQVMLQSLDLAADASETPQYTSGTATRSTASVRRPGPGALATSQVKPIAAANTSSSKQLTGPSDFDWKSGVYFTPKAPGPRYTLASGHIFNLGTTFVGGAKQVPGIGLYEMGMAGFQFVGTGSRVVLFLELPPGKASYMVAIVIAGDTPDSVNALLPVISAWVYDADPGPKPMQLVPIAKGAGVVGLCNVNPMNDINSTLSQEARKYWNMRVVSAYVDVNIGNWFGSEGTIWQPAYLVFSGVLVTKV